MDSNDNCAFFTRTVLLLFALNSISIRAQISDYLYDETPQFWYSRDAERSIRKAGDFAKGTCPCGKEINRLSSQIEMMEMKIKSLLVEVKCSQELMPPRIPSKPISEPAPKPTVRTTEEYLPEESTEREPTGEQRTMSGNSAKNLGSKKIDMSKPKPDESEQYPIPVLRKGFSFMG